MAEKSDLVGKKKIVVDESAYASLYRSPVSPGSPMPGAQYLALNYPRKDMFGGSYAPLDSAVDRLRAFLGKSWDHRKAEPASNATSPASAAEAQANENPIEKVFKNSWPSVRCFGNLESDVRFPLQLVMCDDQEIHTPAAGNPDLSVGAPFYTPSIHTVEDKINVNCSVLLGALPSQIDWAYFLKTGIDLNGTFYPPVIDTQRFFYDHYHEAQAPFTPKELLSKQPMGKSSFADFNTFYNETLRSEFFESVLRNRKDVQNSIPTPYSFLKLIEDKGLIEEETFDLNSIISDIIYFYKNGEGPNAPYGDANVYVELLSKYPLETLATLYGVVGTELGPLLEVIPQLDLGGFKTPQDVSKLIEKIITLDYEKFEVTGLFEDYINLYASYLYFPEFAVSQDFYGRISALENKFRTLVFDPNVIPIMEKVEKYKHNFPFSVDLEFNAKLQTELGDMMKTFHLTRPLSYILSPRFSRLATDQKQTAFQQDILSSTEEDLFEPSTLNFIDYTQEDIYKITNQGPELEYTVSPYRSDAEPKDTMEFASTFLKWVDMEDFHPNENTANYFSDHADIDIRNYVTFFKSGVNEPGDLDDSSNFAFKKLFGSAFYGKIADVYNKNRRTYQDILNGVPAYTEDLFYRIKKERKFTEDGSEWQTVQNVLIPNTSDLDIVKYVDTQLKYSTAATYRFTVFTERVVFGSAYRYNWPSDGAAARDNPPSQSPVYGPAAPPSPFTSKGQISYPPAASKLSWIQDTTKSDGIIDMIDPFTKKKIGELNTGTADFTATLYVRVHPSIQIIEDKLFEIEEVMVMDRPPVRPDINILPYRAINNRIKILLTGNVDKSVEEPIIILDEDKDEFNKVKKSQLSFDGKVEFASDDSVKTFQLFRSETRPNKYSDFKDALYKEINNFVFEEKILPNKKYYYTFRAKDPHDHVSNPTDVYEVELIDEKGAVKPIIRIISMDPPEIKNSVKECQKYIYIKPSLKQLYFSGDSEVDGVFSDVSKKKRYKMRLTSKGSGKKIDINFSLRKRQTE